VEIKQYELIPDRGGFTLVVHLDPHLEEFANELGASSDRKTTLQVQIHELIREKFPYIHITAAKVMVGSFLMTTIYFGPDILKAGAETTTAGQVQQSGQYDTYKVVAGDSLFGIAKKFNVTVTDIKNVNKLTSDSIYVGQVLNLPYYTYTVVAGDTLYGIARKFNATVDSVRSYNQLSSDYLSIGQKLKIPRTGEPATPVVTQPTVTPTPTPAPAPSPAPTGTNTTTTTYKVAVGDTLYGVAKKFATTVDAIKKLNNLSSDTLFVGQMLLVPQTQGIQSPVPVQPAPSPEPTVTTYTVVSGDSLFLIAMRFDLCGTNVKNTISNYIKPQKAWLRN
jgi:LysM repeat protein